MSPPERDLVTRGAISSRVRYHVDRERSNFAVDPKVSVLKVASSDSMAPSAINILTPLLVLVLLLILGVEDVEARPPNIMDLILMKLLLCEVAATPLACLKLLPLPAKAPTSSSPKTNDPSMVATSRRDDGILDGCLTRLK